MDANIETKHFLKKEQAGLYACGASRATIDRWIKDGLPGKLPPLPALKIGRRVMIELPVLHAWLAGAPSARSPRRGRPPKIFSPTKPEE